MRAKTKAWHDTDITIGESIGNDTIAALGTRIEVTKFLENRVSSLAPIDSANEPDDLPLPADEFIHRHVTELAPFALGNLYAFGIDLCALSQAPKAILSKC